MSGSPSSESVGGVSAALRQVFHEAQVEGRIGPGSIDRQIEHALGFVQVLTATAGGTRNVLDLGSGAGLPGLVLAEKLRQFSVTLLDGRAERARALERAVATLDLGERVTVLGVRAEEAGRIVSLRQQFDVVVARAFARPGVTAECAAPFLRLDGLLIVAEPPGHVESDERWPAEGCAEFGLELLNPPDAPFAFVCLRQVGECPDIYPRRVGIPAKRPRF